MSLMTTNQNDEDFTKQLSELDKISDTCRNLMKTKHYATIGEAGICAIMARAKALGIHPFEALNGGFHCINGKVGMSTEMMAALVRQKGHSIQKDQKSNSEICILHGKRADNGDQWTCTFSKADAEAAGLWTSATWKKYPGVMLYNRCMSMLFRQLFPDLSLGAGYVEDELEEIAREKRSKKPSFNPEFSDESEITILEISPQGEKKPSVDDINILKRVFKECPEIIEKAMDKKIADMGCMCYADLPKDEFDSILKYARSKIVEKAVE